MKKSMKFATALAGAAVVVAGGTAFTNGNDMISTRTYGYGETAVTGVTVASEVVNRNATDNSKIDSIVFTTSAPAVDLASGFTAKLQVNGGGTALNYNCTFGAYSAPTNTITCDTDGTPGPSAQLTAEVMEKIGLTVYSDAND